MTNELFNFNVVTLGASGSGKTVFLSSMLHELSTQGDRGFFLRVDDQDLQKLLNQLYRQVVTGEKWPQGNDRKTIHQWKFTCFVQSKKDQSIFPACQFTYLDYAGSTMTDYEEGDETFAPLDEAIQRAHILVGLLDGGKLLKAMQGDQGAWNQIILNDLPPILQKMQFSKAPVHFVISKWDLLQDQFSLDAVRQRLLEYPHFRNIVESRNEAKHVVRLIPVSSVGKKFAIPQANGEMKKTGNFPEPFQVEMPLACIIPDLMESSLDQILLKQQELKERVEEVEAKLSWWDKAAQATVKAIKIAQWFLPFDIADIAFEVFEADELLLGAVNRKIEDAKEQTEKLRQKRDEELKHVESQETAFKHTLTSFTYLRNILEQRFPGSILAGSNCNQPSESNETTAMLSQRL